MQFEQAGQFIMNKLRRELPAHLSYHNADHTADVCEAAERIGRQESLNEYELKLLLTAACFHDSGFLEGFRDHEQVSCGIAQRSLPGFGYNEEEVTRICGMIMATKIPQQPTNHMEEILADADLDYLGRDDFFLIGETLFSELKITGILKTEKQWNTMQVAFLERHHYFTTTAIEWRQAKKQQHLDAVKAKLKQQNY